MYKPINHGLRAIILPFIAFLLTMAPSAANAQLLNRLVKASAKRDYPLSSMVERLESREKLEKDRLKQLKKQYKASKVQIERWSNDSTYYVLYNRAGQLALVREDMTPLVFKCPKIAPDRKSAEQAKIDWYNDFFYCYTINLTEMNGKQLYLVRTKDDFAEGLYKSDGSNIVPATFCKNLKGFSFHGKDYYSGTVSNGNLWTLSDDGFLVSPSIQGGIRLVDATAPGFVPARDDTGAEPKFWSPGYERDCIIFNNDKTDNVYIPDIDSTPAAFKRRTKTVLPVDGYVALTFSKRPNISVRSTMRDNGTGLTYPYREITVENRFKNLNNLSLATVDGKILIDSCTRFTISAPDQVAYFVKYYGKPYFIYRLGAVSLTDSANRVAPRFNSVYAATDSAGHTAFTVKKSLYDLVVPYAPDMDTVAVAFADPIINKFEQVYSSINLAGQDDSYLLSAIKLSHIPVPDMTSAQKCMFMIALNGVTDTNLKRQNDIIANYAAGTDPKTVTRLKSYISDDPVYGTTYKGASDLITKWRIKLDSIADMTADSVERESFARVATYVRGVETDLDHNYTIAIPEAAKAFQAQQLAELQRRQEEEAARQAEIQQQRQQQIANAIFGIITNTLSGITSGHSSSRRSAGVSGGSSRGSAKASSGAAASSSRDTSGDKARLKREIAEWEAKLKKAEQSYAQALQNYESNKTWEAKRVVDSKLNTINEFAAERDRCLRELESL